MKKFLNSLNPMCVFVLILSLAGCATPLVRAVKKGQTQKVVALIEKGSAIDDKALMWAAYRGDAETVKVLLDQGADVNKKKATFWDFGDLVTPLMIAVRYGHTDAVRILLDHGADVNLKHRGVTALFYAAFYGHSDIVNILLAKGAAVSATDIQYAELNGYKTLAELLDRVSKKQSSQILGENSLAPDSTASASLPQNNLIEQPVLLKSEVDVPIYKAQENPNDFALVIGVEKYSNQLPDAQFAERDAEAIKNHLIALGVPPRQIKLLTNHQATKANVEAYLEEWLPRNVKEPSRVFFYYSGHGAPDLKSGQAYLVLYDGNPDFLGITGYPIKKLYSILNSLKTKEIIVAIDSCFSGAGGRSVLAQGARPLVTKVDVEIPAANKMTIFSASAGNEISGTIEDQGHGAFTYYFLKGLNGEAIDRSGQVTAQSLYDYLKPKVQDAANLKNRDQTPQLVSSKTPLKLR